MTFQERTRTKHLTKEDILSKMSQAYIDPAEGVEKDEYGYYRENDEGKKVRTRKDGSALKKIGISKGEPKSYPKVATIVWNKKTGSMELRDPKSKYNNEIAVFKKFKRDLENSGWVNTHKDQYKEIFGVDGPRALISEVKFQKKKLYRAGASDAQRELWKQLKDNHPKGEQPEALRNRTGYGNAARSIVKRSITLARQKSAKASRVGLKRKLVPKTAAELARPSYIRSGQPGYMTTAGRMNNLTNGAYNAIQRYRADEY